MNDIEAELYKKFDAQKPDLSPKEIFQQLSAFWQHFALHKRKSDHSGKTIISVFDPNCPYPVWHHDEWIKDANPPGADFDPSRPFFEQLWELFQQCPIPHNTGAGNENCEYTDDWWYSKNCYLSHSGFDNEECNYCFRVLKSKDCQYCVFSFNSELCTDLINCTECYAVNYALNSKNCRNSAFLFDCRNCSDCFFSWNLRNKKYCIFNVQYSKEEYEQEKAKYDFSSRKQYSQAKKDFFDVLRSKAWWRDQYLVQCENCSGDVLENCKNCQNCYFIQNSEDCVNSMRAYGLKDTLNVVTGLNSELLYYSSMAQDKCYDIRYSYDIIQCKFIEYSAHLHNCQHCFGCCGLVNKKYHIFNKEYSPEDYAKKVEEIKAKLKADGVYGKFFPNHFAACPYDESLAGFHWPLSAEEQKTQGYRLKEYREEQHPDYSPTDEIPDRPDDANPEICKKSFWDEQVQHPFQITEFDLKYAKTNKVPLPNQYYIRRLKENFSMMFFNGELRESTCAKTGEKIQTSLPKELDSRILSREAYLKEVG